MSVCLCMSMQRSVLFNHVGVSGNGVKKQIFNLTLRMILSMQLHVNNSVLCHLLMSPLPSLL